MPDSELPWGTSGSVLSEGNNDSDWLQLSAPTIPQKQKERVPFSEG